MDCNRIEETGSSTEPATEALLDDEEQDDVEAEMTKSGGAHQKRHVSFVLESGCLELWHSAEVCAVKMEETERKHWQKTAAASLHAMNAYLIQRVPSPLSEYQ